MAASGPEMSSCALKLERLRSSGGLSWFRSCRELLSPRLLLPDAVLSSDGGCLSHGCLRRSFALGRRLGVLSRHSARKSANAEEKVSGRLAAHTRARARPHTHT